MRRLVSKGHVLKQFLNRFCWKWTPILESFPWASWRNYVEVFSLQNLSIARTHTHDFSKITKCSESSEGLQKSFRTKSSSTCFCIGVDEKHVKIAVHSLECSNLHNLPFCVLSQQVKTLKSVNHRLRNSIGETPFLR